MREPRHGKRKLLIASIGIASVKFVGSCGAVANLMPAPFDDNMDAGPMPGVDAGDAGSDVEASMQDAADGSPQGGDGASTEDRLAPAVDANTDGTLE
jgi:hypothetical protein